MKVRSTIALVCLLSLILLLPGAGPSTFAQQPGATDPGAGQWQVTGEPGGPWLTPEGYWAVPAEYEPRSSGTTGLLDTGGPDDFGYTWDDAVPLEWRDASDGNDALYVGAIPIGFSFKFYEYSYDQLYVSRNGFVTFTGDQFMYASPQTFPSPLLPNNLIAPIALPLDTVNGYVHYLSGGSAPNRWFVVEWNRVALTWFEPSGPDEYTFEVVLHENGDIVFQYGAITKTGYRSLCDCSGIEDSTGWDGLTISEICDQVESNHAVRIYRPAPSARVRIVHRYLAQFIRAGENAAFLVPVRNTGDLGTDTYDLIPTSSWDVAFYNADTLAPLSDTDGDGDLDTGPVAMASTFDVLVQVQTPAGVNVGDSNTASILARSSVDTDQSRTVTIRTAYPAPFAQSYSDDVDDAMSLYLAQPSYQSVVEGGPDGTAGSYPAVAEMPNGFVYFWTKSRTVDGFWVSEIFYALLDHVGNVVRPLTQLTSFPAPAGSSYDWSPATAVLPNGRIGVVWRRQLNNSSTGQHNENIYLAVLNAAGDVVYGPANVTNNSIWGTWSEYNVPGFESPVVAATDDSRFVLAWTREYVAPPDEDCSESCSVRDIYYSVRDGDGTVIKPITQWTSDTPGVNADRAASDLASLSGGKVLLAWNQIDWFQPDTGDIFYAVLDSDGDVVKNSTNLVEDGSTVFDELPDAAQLSDGQIVIAWHGGDFFGPDHVRYAVLDANYDRIAGPITLSNPAAPRSEGGVSVAADADGHAVLTWADKEAHRGSLYYALLDGSGTQLVPPMTFLTSQAEIPILVVNGVGYGNTSYNLVTPTTDGVDFVLEADPLVESASEGIAHLTAPSTNLGLTAATSVQVTAEIDPALGFVDAWPAPLPGALTQEGEVITWELPDLGFLGGGWVDLWVRLPEAVAGTTYPVTWTISSGEPDANPSDNTVIVQVMVMSRTYLPLVLKGQ